MRPIETEEVGLSFCAFRLLSTRARASKHGLREVSLLFHEDDFDSSLTAM